MGNILTELSQKEIISNLKEEDLDNIVVGVFTEFSTEINSIKNKLKFCADIHSNVDLLNQAYDKEIKDLLRKALHEYIFEHKKWNIDFPIRSYLRHKLYFFMCNAIARTKAHQKYIQERICPICKTFFNHKEFLIEGSDKKLTCQSCYEQLHLFDDRKIELSLERQKLIKAFHKHSKSGVRCPSCNNFVPISCKNEEGNIVCPYDDTVCGLDYMSHPKALMLCNVPLHIGSSSSSEEASNNQEDAVVGKEAIYNKISVLNDIITKRLPKTNKQKVSNIHKYFMYNAISNITKKMPKESISYFTYGKFFKSSPIQPIIFQEFANLVIDQLPLSVRIKNNKIEINNILDPQLKIFSGDRMFVDTLSKDLTLRIRPQFKIENNYWVTDEEKSFIGLLISIEDAERNCSLMEHIETCSFTFLKFKPTILGATSGRIRVRYYSLLPNYTIQSMATLQRIRKQIFNSSQKRIINNE